MNQIQNDFVRKLPIFVYVEGTIALCAAKLRSRFNFILSNARDFVELLFAAGNYLINGVLVEICLSQCPQSFCIYIADLV